MFSRILAVASLAALAIAGPLNARGGTPSQQCNTGTLQCCQQVQQTSDLQQFLNSFGLVDALVGASALVGANCNPISVLGTGNGAQCNTQPVCCTSDQMLGAVNMGCMPINVNA